MAKQIARILKTDMMADMNMPALAQLLQKMGRGKDKVLAHITKEEAKLLKKRGGAGTRNPETGLLEFAEEDYGQGDTYIPEDMPTSYETPPETPIELTGSTPEQPYKIPTEQVPRSSYADLFAGQAGEVPTTGATPSLPSTVYQGVDYKDTGTAFAPEGAGGGTATPPPEEKGLLAGLTSQDKMRLGLGGLSTGLAAILGQKGVKQAQQAATATKDIGKPYRDTGQALQASALRGELTPAGQQSLQAAQAQLAQGQERRGGVGAQQSATQLATLRQNLLDQQYKYGLQVAQIGDQYAARAIQQGLTGDQQMAQLMMNLTGNLSSLLGGLPQSKPVTPASTAPAA